MFKKEWLFYLLSMITLSWNLSYFILMNINIEDISWKSVLDNISTEKLSSSILLLFPLLALIITSSSIIVNLLLSFYYKKKQCSSFSAMLFILPISIIVSLILSMYSQLYFADKVSDNIMFWLSKELIWILGSMVIIGILVAIGTYQIQYNSKFDEEKNNKINDLKLSSSKIRKFENIPLETYKFASKKHSPQTAYIPNNDYLTTGATMGIAEDFNLNEENDFYSEMATESLQFNKNVNPPKLALSENDDFDNEFINNSSKSMNNFNDNSINNDNLMNNNIINDVELPNISNNLSSIQSNQIGFTQQIKAEYQKDFILVQELHRINMGQSNVRLTKLINIFYNRYERGLDLDIDRVMLLIYRVTLDYEPLLGYLRDAILYKLDSKFISDLARGWFKSYSNKVNSLYNINRQSFKKFLLEGITIMDNDIEKYLQEVSNS